MKKIILFLVFITAAACLNAQSASRLIAYSQFYISASVGIIKMCLHHPQDTIYDQNRVWELERHSIIL